MSGWTDVFLGVIAAATLVTAIIQVGVLVAAGLLARRLSRLTERVEQELKPIFGHLDSIGRDAARAVSVATAQVDRVDSLFADFASRAEQTMDVVQNAAAAPAREVTALLTGIRAALATLRDARRGRPRARGEDEDALFI